jgi:hypothetical protein
MDFKRKFGVGCIALGLASGVLSFGAGAVQSAVAAPGTTCTQVSAKLTISPGLTTLKSSDNLEKVINGMLGGCNGGVTKGTFSTDLRAKDQSCTAGESKGIIGFTWDNKTLSKGKATLKITEGGEFTLSVSIDEGDMFNPSSGTGKFSLTPVKGDCTKADPMTEATFVNKGDFTI